MMLKKLLLSMTFICLFLSAPMVNAYAADAIYGDVDQNSEISLRDALKILLHVVKSEQLSDEQIKYADVNKDGRVDSVDALQIMEYYLGERADFKANEIIASGVVWIAGDSIAAPGNKNRPVPQYGWGEVIGDYFTEEVTVHDNALGGRSSKSFLQDKNYQEIMDNIKPGDYLLISFGHNDCKQDETRYTSPSGSSSFEGSYKYYLKTKYIDPALAKGAVPVILSSVVRCSGRFESIYNQSHNAWAIAAVQLSDEYRAQHINVPCIDLFNITFDHYYAIGKTTALGLYHSVDENNEPDSTHYNEAGARWVSKIIVRQLQELDMDIAKYADEEKLNEPDPDIPETEQNLN